MIITAEVNAQCPTTIEPTTFEWTNAGCVTMMVDFGGQVCEAEVCYCWRQMGLTAPLVEVYVHSITPTDPECPPPGLNYRDLLKFAGISLINQNPDDLEWYCTPCPNQLTNYNLYIGACMNGNNYCTEGSAYCRMQFLVCCDPYTGAIQATYQTTTQVGNTCDQGSGCSPTCP